MSDSPSVPTFLGIGPGKAGTTWMYRLLRSHPEVYMSPVKETLYFTDQFHRGRDWYLAFFEGADAFPASGEISNTYVFSDEAPARIRDYRADMRLITCLRHPVDRAFSHYLWLVRNGELAGSFEETLEVRPDLLTRGRYGEHLASWLEVFPREQLLVLAFWELAEDERAFARRIFRFLGVDPDVWPEAAEERALGAARPRSRWAARATKLGARAARRLGLPGLVQAVKESPLVDLLWEPYGEGRPEIAPETRARLTERVAGDVRRLTELTGVDFAGRWLEGTGKGRPMTEHRLDAVGVGPQKTGTTWLDACLRAHPALCLPEGVKETFFLDRHFGRGWDWHATHFERCEPDRLRAEVGPTWFDAPATAERLRARSPRCRIVVTLRDPAERSWSLYRHYRRKGRVGDDFRRAVERVPRIVEASRYGAHLPRWIERFGQEGLHVVLLEEVPDRPERVLGELCRFLEVAPFDGVPAAARERVNPGRRVRLPPLARLAVAASRWLRDRGLHRVADAGKAVAGGLVYGPPDDEGSGAMPLALRAELVEELEADVRFVEELTGRDLSAWRTP